MKTGLTRRNRKTRGNVEAKSENVKADVDLNRPNRPRSG